MTSPQHRCDILDTRIRWLRPLEAFLYNAGQESRDVLYQLLRSSRQPRRGFFGG